jgi:multiple sugar transport system substrate-binding protein/arabinosaccharide transport system substrate-binding protein
VPKGKVLGMVATSMTAPDFFLPFLLQAGGQIFNPDGTVALKSQEAVDALDFVSTAVQTGVFQALENVVAGPGATAIKSGKVIATPCAEWYNKFVLQPTAPEQKGKWREGPLPAFVAGGPQTSFFGGSNLSVAKSSPIADATLELVKAAILTRQAQVVKYKRVGFQPTWKSVYDDPAYLDLSDPFLGGQQLGELYGSLSKNAPSAVVQSPGFSAAMAILGDEVVAAYKGRKSAQTAIADASAAIEAKVTA